MRATRKRKAKEAAAEAVAASSLSASPSVKKKPTKKKAKRELNAEEGIDAACERQDHDVARMDEEPTEPFSRAGPYLPRDLLRIVFQYSPPSQLSRYVPTCPWITSDRLLCRSVMRYFAAQPPVKLTELTQSYHEQTLAGNVINNYPFTLHATHRRSQKFAHKSYEISAVAFLDPEASDLSPDFLEILREAGMWEDEVNAIHTPESAQTLAIFRNTPEYQTYARLAPYNSMFQRVNLPLVSIYHDLPLLSSSPSPKSETGEPQVYERPLHQIETDLWRKWEGPVEKLDVATTRSHGAATESSSSSFPPAAASSSHSAPLPAPIFRSRSSFLSTFNALFLHDLWQATIDWKKFLCVGGSVLRSLLNPAFHDFDQFKHDPAAGLNKQDVDFFWTSRFDFYAYTNSYRAWKRRIREWRGRENVRIISETDYVQVVEVRFNTSDEGTTKAYIPPAQKTGNKHSMRGRKPQTQQAEADEEADEEDEEDEEDNGDNSTHSKPSPPGGRIVTFNFIWYDSSLSPSSILNIFDLDVCQVAWSGSECLITPAGLEALRTRSMLNYKLVNSPKDVRYIAPRSRKYVARGFRLYVPHSFRDEVLTSAWEQAVKMTERTKKKMVMAEAERRAREGADPWKKKAKLKHKSTTANFKAGVEHEPEGSNAPINLSSIPTPALTPSDMNTVKLDRGEGRKGHFAAAVSKTLLHAPDIEEVVLEDEEGKEGDESEGEAEEPETGDWDGQTHYSGFLLNNDSMRVRQSFLEKVVQGASPAEW